MLSPFELKLTDAARVNLRALESIIDRELKKGFSPRKAVLVELSEGPEISSGLIDLVISKYKGLWDVTRFHSVTPGEHIVRFLMKPEPEKKAYAGPS